MATQSDTSSAPRPLCLPTPLTSFVGRARELEDLKHLFEGGSRLVTVVGPPGIGKTRATLRAAQDQLDRVGGEVRFVDLGGVADGALVVRAVAAALDVREQPGRELVDDVIAHIGSNSALIVLDNCEHLASDCARVCALLLSECPRLQIACTSRQPLDIAGESVYRLSPLPEDDALSLFVDRAAAARQGFGRVPTDISAAKVVCRQLEGIPLAIELTAVWVRMLAIEQIAARLDDRLRLLSHASSVGPERHQTLRNAIAWSYELLSPAERSLFNRLGVFAGGFALEAAEAVCAGDGIEVEDVLHVLANLVDKSMVVAEPRAGATRFWLLETLRQYAFEQLEESGEETATRDRHREWCVTVAEQGERDIWRAHQLQAIERLEREHDNIRAALAWTLARRDEPEPGLRIGAAMTRFWHTQGDVREGCNWLSRLLNLPSVRRQTVHWARAMTSFGYLTALRQDGPQAIALLDEVLPFWRAVGDPRGLAVATFFRGMVAAWPTADAASLPYFEQSLSLARQRGPHWTIYLSLWALGEGARMFGDFARADAMLREATTMADEAGDRFGSALLHGSLALLALNQQNVKTAREYALKSLKQSLEMRDPLEVSVALEVLACIAVAQGNSRRATHLFGAADHLRAPVGDYAHSTARIEREQAIEAARHELGQASFEEEWSIGQAMSFEETIAYAGASDRQDYCCSTA